MAPTNTRWIVVLVLCVLGSQVDVDALMQTKRTLPRRCSHARVHKMLAVDCNGMDLKSIPQNLESDIEVIDVTFNRIRELRKDSFARYSNLKYLYLQENIISRIQEGTFKDLQKVEVVKLSLNPIKKIPHDLFYLPNLRKLSLDEIELDDDNFDDLLELPNIPTLTSLSLSNSRLRVLPPLSKFPFIQFLNVSGNYLTTISASQLAPACFLLQIDLNYNSDLFQRPSCNCTTLLDWTSKHNISLVSPYQLICPRMEQSNKECINISRNENENLYNSCRALHIERITQAEWNKIWIIVGTVLAVCFVIFVALFWFIHRKCKTKSMKASQIPSDDSINNLNDTPVGQMGEVQKNLLVDHHNI